MEQIVVIALVLVLAIVVLAISKNSKKTKTNQPVPEPEPVTLEELQLSRQKYLHALDQWAEKPVSEILRRVPQDMRRAASKGELYISISLLNYCTNSPAQYFSETMHWLAEKVIAAIQQDPQYSKFNTEIEYNHAGEPYLIIRWGEILEPHVVHL